MSLTRRSALLGGAAVLAMPGILTRLAIGQESGVPLPLPRVVDASETGAFTLVAVEGETEFHPGARSRTMGFGQPYLGPVVRVRTGTTVQATVENRAGEVVSVHWHGLLVPGIADGGPHNPIAPGEVWTPALSIDQPAATLWYHTHIHGRTAPGVHAGLAGVLIVDDGGDEARGLPHRMGEDDLVLVLQDRRFDRAGTMVYSPNEADIMHGFLGDTIVVNGAINPTAEVPAGLVRLRLVNGSNGRNYELHLDDGGPFHLIASDQGYLPAPLEVRRLRLAPGERAELLVDFASGRATRLMSSPHRETPGGGGMGHNMAMATLQDPFAAPFPVVSFRPDRARSSSAARLPGALAEAIASPSPPSVTRTFTLNDMMMMMGGAGMGGMGGMAMGGPMAMGGHSMQMGGQADAAPAAMFGINGSPFDMGRIDLEATAGQSERWLVRGQEMGHPFHVHGARFRVMGPPEQAQRPENAGWKDTVLAEGEVELWVEFEHPATAEHPFMFHCHVLEHEDRGMMGQFVVLAKAAVSAEPQFELVGEPTRVGAGRIRFGIRLTIDGQPVPNAEISAVDFNMSPEGMDHSSAPVPASRGDDGTQYFEVVPDMVGRWQVVLRGRVPGIDRVLASKLTLDVPN